MGTMPRASRISDPEELLKFPRGNFSNVRALCSAALLGTSLSVEQKIGWVINLRILRKISNRERQELESVVHQFDVPIAVTECDRPPQLYSSDHRRSGIHLKV